MTVVLLGGIKRLEGHYRNRARKKKVKLKVFNQSCPRLRKSLPVADGVVLFTGEVSHNDAKLAYNISRIGKKPLVKCHSSSLSGLEKALETLLSNSSNGG